MIDLRTARCVPCHGGTAVLHPDVVEGYLLQCAGWALEPGGTAITRTFTFPDYWQTMAFVNAVAWIAHTQDHHPALTVGYGTVTVRYWTHAVGGLTESDFICAAQINQLVPA